MTWRPHPRAGVEILALPLDPRQGYLLSLLNGVLDVPALATLLNVDESQVAILLEQLVTLGAVEAEGPGHQAECPAAGAKLESEKAPASEDDGEADRHASRTHEASQRQLFEQYLHARPIHQRVVQARVAVEPDLSAWCFDPTAEVIRAVLENPRLGNVHARLIATHHRTVAGLEVLGARAAFVNDDGVRRALLQNPLLPPGLYRRLWSPRRLQEQYLVAISREVPEQVRAMARDLLRTSFHQRTGEERAELILTTEGRCLATLVGITIDGHTTALLCRRTYSSTLLIQNIARWSAAPPQLIAHLRRQDVVKRNATLRQLLERHPNAS